MEREYKSTLIAHVDTNKVSYEQLKAIALPASTKTWRPVAHLELVDVLKDEIVSRGFVIAREEFAVNPMGSKLFGTFDLETRLIEGVASAIGFRHANDKSMALWTVAGARVFVCDNLSLTGDATILKQKHTWGYNLRSLINRGLDAWQNKRIDMIDGLERMQNTPLSDTQAQALLGKALYDGVTTQQTFRAAYELYFVRAVNSPEQYPDCAPRSAWGLHNAYTRALKLSQPNIAFNTTIDLGKLFKI